MEQTVQSMPRWIYPPKKLPANSWNVITWPAKNPRLLLRIRSGLSTHTAGSIVTFQDVVPRDQQYKD
jgi:hypothetical protein